MEKQLMQKPPWKNFNKTFPHDDYQSWTEFYEDILKQRCHKAILKRDELIYGVRKGGFIPLLVIKTLTLLDYVERERNNERYYQEEIVISDIPF